MYIVDLFSFIPFCSQLKHNKGVFGEQIWRVLPIYLKQEYVRIRGIRLTEVMYVSDRPEQKFVM